jgi:hypothetical protein
VSKIYVDGCSFTYGEGLDRKFSLGNLLSAEIDMSYPGKSNAGIVYDVYQNLKLADIFVIGLTFSCRTTLWDSNKPLGVNPNKTSIDQLSINNGAELETDYTNFHKVFYTLYNDNYMNRLSDFYADGLISLLNEQQKTVVIFSWERRNSIHKIMYPHINNRLPDGHLTEAGMEKLAELVKQQYE